MRRPTRPWSCNCWTFAMERLSSVRILARSLPWIWSLMCGITCLAVLWTYAGGQSRHLEVASMDCDRWWQVGHVVASCVGRCRNSHRRRRLSFFAHTSVMRKTAWVMRFCLSRAVRWSASMRAVSCIIETVAKSSALIDINSGDQPS